ncbi:MAG: hypothetical protein HN368_07805 [Spirochaetales bacterium]|jgi:hypothetical protein|nr:hypothetical protein [Spirochaetales bacterium]
MRKKYLYFTLILIVLLFTGCAIFTPNVHRIRIVSAVSDGPLPNVKIGDVSFNDVEPGGTTSYGDFIRGTEYSVTFGAEDTPITTLSVAGLGTHLWTLNIGGTLSNMTFVLTEDM